MRKPSIAIAVVICLLFLSAMLLQVHHQHSNRQEPGSSISRFSASKEKVDPIANSSSAEFRAGSGSPTAEQIVAEKLSQFARSRRRFANALAKHHNITIPHEVEDFFAAVESGDWDKIDSTFKRINGGDSSASQNDTRPPGVAELWPAIIDAYGVAEQVHLWPAPKLLDYGNAVLGALRPGMVYVGGTDEGRWVPELLNDTSGADQHVVITQNALAAGDYQEYLRLQYPDQLVNLTDEENSKIFDTYVADARKRLEHDQQFPDEPKQLRPGEDVRIVDGKAQVSGAVAVMGINELLLQKIMQKNPDLSFAIQESFPFKNTYSDALPLGPLMELGAAGPANSFTTDRAVQTVEYWREVAQKALEDPESANSEVALRSYSHNTVAAAHLLASHDFSAEAEQAYQLGTKLWPGNPESVGGLADLLQSTGREEEARQLLDTFSQKYPDQRQALERTSTAWHLLWTTKQPELIGTH